MQKGGEAKIGTTRGEARKEIRERGKRTRRRNKEKIVEEEKIKK